MQKYKILLFVFLLIFGLQSAAQNEKPSTDSLFAFNSQSKNMAGFVISGFLTEDTFFEYIGLRYGKFIKQNVVIGAELGRSWFGEWERTSHLGVNMRYYYAVRKNFSYYVQSCYLFGLRTYSNERTLSEWNGVTNHFALNLGIAFTRIYKKQIGLEFFTGYAYNKLHINNHPALGEYNWSKSDIGYGFQINYHF